MVICFWTRSGLHELEELCFYVVFGNCSVGPLRSLSNNDNWDSRAPTISMQWHTILFDDKFRSHNILSVIDVKAGQQRYIYECIAYYPRRSHFYDSICMKNLSTGRNDSPVNELQLNPLTASAEFIRCFTQLLPHSVPPFQHVKAIIWHQSARFEKSWPPFCQISIIFTHAKLWIASAGHNFKWVKIPIE